MKKKRSLFGLISAVLSAALVIFIYLRLSSLSAAAAEEGAWAKLGYEAGMILLRKFLIRAVLGVLFAFIGYFARVKWAYLVGCILIILALVKLPPIAGILVAGILIPILMLAAFIVDHIIQRNH